MHTWNQPINSLEFDDSVVLVKNPCSREVATFTGIEAKIAMIE